MKKKLNPIPGRKEGLRHRASNAISYIRKKENDALKLDDPDLSDMVMDDEAVLAAWEEVKRQLSEDEKT